GQVRRGGARRRPGAAGADLPGVDAGPAHRARRAGPALGHGGPGAARPRAQRPGAGPVPQDPDERSAWLVAGAHRLGRAVREVGPATEVWTWSEDPTAGFWLRRTTHDTLVHRADAELAVGREVTLPPALAADGAAHLLDLSGVRPRIDDSPELAGLAGHGQTLQFRATDAGLGGAGEWLGGRERAGRGWGRGRGA